jgi:hypothetical protein
VLARPGVPDSQMKLKTIAMEAGFAAFIIAL